MQATRLLLILSFFSQQTLCSSSSMSSKDEAPEALIQIKVKRHTAYAPLLFTVSPSMVCLKLLAEIDKKEEGSLREMAIIADHAKEPMNIAQHKYLNKSLQDLFGTPLPKKITLYFMSRYFMPELSQFLQTFGKVRNIDWSQVWYDSDPLTPSDLYTHLWNYAWARKEIKRHCRQFTDTQMRKAIDNYIREFNECYHNTCDLDTLALGYPKDNFFAFIKQCLNPLEDSSSEAEELSPIKQLRALKEQVEELTKAIPTLTKQKNKKRKLDS